MRIVTYRGADGDDRSGVLIEGNPVKVVDLSRAWSILDKGASIEDPGIFRDTIALFGAGPAGLDAARRLRDAAGERHDDEKLVSVVSDLDSVQLRAPVRAPRLRDYFTQDAHAKGAGATLPGGFDLFPLGYKGNHCSIIGPDEDIVWPPFSDQIDFELEPAFVIGAGGRNIPADEAYKHIAGVTIFNDVSARDIQLAEWSLCGPSKGKDFCNVIGPTIATLDELDEFDLTLEARINGERWAQSSTADRRYSMADVVAWASYGENVYPGEVLAIGTVEHGCGAELDRWIQPGDVVELEMTGVGVLRNTVGDKEIAPSGAGLPSYTGSPRFERATLTKVSGG